MAQQHTGSGKRFGPRYGRKNRLAVAAAEKQYKGKKPCPFCQKNGVKRLSAGIFKCVKCSKVFAGRAYTTEGTNV